MRIRRYETEYVFNKLNESKLYDGSYNQNSKFLCIARYNVCINLKPSSIRFFFTYVYKVRTYKTYFIWFLLLLVSVAPFLHHILDAIGLHHEIKETASYKNFNWQNVDLIYVEWHFFGVFSKKDNTVAHILAKETYHERFLNELNARQHDSKFNKLFPKLIRYSNNPKFYVEELAVDPGQQLIGEKHFKKSQKKLKKINKQTLKSSELDAYYFQLIDKIGNLENENLLVAFQRLKDNMEANYLGKEKKIELALVHGDFNTGQILIKNNKIKIIDWGDGGFLNRFFDYISISIYKAPDNSFKHEHFPNDFDILKKFFKKKLMRIDNHNLYVNVTLLEILSISKGEFEANEGAYNRWLVAVNNNC